MNKIKNSIAYLSLGIVAMLLLASSGCGDKYYDNIYQVNGSQIKVVTVDIKETDWKWNADAGMRRYEVVVPSQDITPALFDNGVVLGYLYMDEEIDGQIYKEVQQSLPYIRTYDDNFPELGVDYTETISYSIYDDQDGSGFIFYIQASNLDDDIALVGNYNFRMTLIENVKTGR